MVCGDLLVVVLRGPGDELREWGLILDQKTSVLSALSPGSIGAGNPKLLACVGLVLKSVGGVPVSTRQEVARETEDCGCLEVCFEPQAGYAAVLLTRRSQGAGMPWGLVFEGGTMDLKHCTAGSVAASSAQAKACIGKELAKVNGKPVCTAREFSRVIEGLDAIGLQFRCAAKSAAGGRIYWTPLPETTHSGPPPACLTSGSVSFTSVTYSGRQES
eukprot:gene15838-biopygen7964